MARRNDVTRPTPAQIAHATAAAIPSEISTSPLLGIGAGQRGRSLQDGKPAAAPPYTIGSAHPTGRA
jgi:hypothetical protein